MNHEDDLEIADKGTNFSDGSGYGDTDGDGYGTGRWHVELAESGNGYGNGDDVGFQTTGDGCSMGINGDMNGDGQCLHTIYNQSDDVEGELGGDEYYLMDDYINTDDNI